MTESARELSERLLRSPMQRLSRRVIQVCRRLGLPYVHCCWWDRHCREFGAPRRTSVHWARHMVYVDLFEDVGWWPPLSFGHHASSRNAVERSRRRRVQ